MQFNHQQCIQVSCEYHANRNNNMDSDLWSLVTKKVLSEAVESGQQSGTGMEWDRAPPFTATPHYHGYRNLRTILACGCTFSFFVGGRTSTGNRIIFTHNFSTSRRFGDMGRMRGVHWREGKGGKAIEDSRKDRIVERGEGYGRITGLRYYQWHVFRILRVSAFWVARATVDRWYVRLLWDLKIAWPEMVSSFRSLSFWSEMREKRSKWGESFLAKQSLIWRGEPE